ncbi:hypothetical protein HD554DRAFT_2288449 [Boletus coccyginus]|nr:hypothetical protein HD554DRAFT_2288449 [Boletus coccyginus]
MQAFAPSTLADSEGLTAASRMLKSCLAGPDIPLDLIVQDLCAIPNLFEFIVSALPSAEGLVHRILDTYPTDPALVEASPASMLLRRLSSVIFALPPDLLSTDTVRRRIGRYKVYVEDALPVLTVSCFTDFSTSITADGTPANANDVRNKRQKESKRKHKNTASTIDVAPFHRLGVKVPLNDAEASQIASKISDNLKMILKFYLDLLLEPFLERQFRDAYVSTGNATTVHPSAAQENKVIEAVKPKPSAHPKVQPMKAALYFENADDFGEWRIIIGTDATKKLRELAKGDRKKCVIVVKKIKELSNGHFSDDNQKRLNGFLPLCNPYIRSKDATGPSACLPDRDGEVERQVIKIYGVYTHTQLNRIWDAMGQQLAGKGKEYRRRCIFRNRPVHTGGDVYLPACFPPESLQNDTKPALLVLSDEDMGELHSLLVLEKYVTFSQAFLHSLIVNQDVQHVFELTPEELKIVQCKTSCYVLGRSGTGKTTTMLFKMLGIQRAWETQTSGMPKPRQIFVTKSRVLATKVQEYFLKLLGSLALAGYSLEELKRIRARNTDFRLVDADDEAQTDIPRKYSALEESHFPLFVTFDQLARMIAADILGGDDSEAQRFARFFVDSDEIQAQDPFVTYDVFARTYWPHFPQHLTNGLEPWLVFSEFMGIIKGSEKSLSYPDRFLDEEAYCSLPARSNPTFANQRGTLYEIFEAYCKLKKERRQHDVADRTHVILKTLLGGTPLRGQKVDYLYIDEAQDNLLIDALLLRLLCRNPEGLIWAGDTAQTISAGSSFRFDDLKAFLYRIEQDQSAHVIQDRSVIDPAAFQLAINYRSHGGIVNCAHTVIERIIRFWPDAIDVLQPERGIVQGFKPVFFRGWDQDTVQYEQFLFGASGRPIEFGAQQCILVRDDEALEKLRKEVGSKIGLIMTLYDSKGLEFNDVLLYNFFEDSAIDISRWRVLLNHAEGEVDGQGLVEVHAPSFGRDEGRFAGVCSELKLLYVGITRARKNLWIFDKSDKSEPMRMIWTSRNQVRNCTPGTDEVPHLAVSSTAEEWESFGHDLFKHRKYSQAMHCFARASLPRMVDICKAFHLREVARAKIGVAPREAQQNAFLAAAGAFMASGKDAPQDEDKLQYYRNAADCYVRAEDDRKAADAYIDAREYDLAARRFRKAGRFDKTLEVLREHSENIPSESSKELYTVCRLFYCSKPDVKRPRLPLFSSVEDELEFLESYDLDLSRATLLENLGRYLEAAEVHLSGNRPLDAIRDLLKKSGSRDAIQKATKIVLDNLWRRCSFGITSKEVAADRDVGELLNLADQLPPDFLDPMDHHEVSMFRAIAQADLHTLEELSRVFIERKRNAAALLALARVFSRLPELKSLTLLEMSLFLDKFRNYARLLHDIISRPNPLSSPPIKRLFCITNISSAEYAVEPGSVLYRSATRGRHGQILSKREMVAALQEYLVAYLCERVTKENELCCDAVVFSQCLTFVVYGRCIHPNCPQEHVKSAGLDSKRYNLRIGVHLHQICILQLMYSVNPRLDKMNYVLNWLTHLYDAFNPQFHVQGSIADLDLSIIPSAHESIGVVKHWVRDAFNTLHADNDRSAFLTTLLKLANLIFSFDAPKRTKQAHHARVQQSVYPDGRHALEDIVSLFDGGQSTQGPHRRKLVEYDADAKVAIEDLVQLLYGKRSNLRRAPPLRLPRTQRIYSANPSEIPSLSTSHPVSVRPDPQADESTFAPRVGHAPIEVDKTEDEEKVQFEEPEVNPVDEVHEEPQELTSAPNEPALVREHEPTGEEISAAEKIQAAYRTYRKHHEAQSRAIGGGSKAQRNTIFIACLRNVYVANWGRSSYRTLYLWALPHLIVCLEKAISIAHEFKSKTKGLLKGDHEHLEAFVKQMNEINALLKEGRQLRKTIEPNAAMHQAREEAAMEKAVLDVKDFIHRLPSPSLAPDIQEDFNVAHELVSLWACRRVLACSGLRADAPAFVPRVGRALQLGKDEDEERTQSEEPEVEPVDEIHEEPQELASAPNQPALVREHEPTGEEISAAEKIQATYRTYRKHHEAQTRTIGKGLKAQRNTIFIACLKNVYAANWGRTPYRTMYLWALPHLIVCLDKAISIAHEFKSKTKGLLLKGNHEHLEELGKQTNRISALLKEGLHLRKIIGPNAVMHQARDKAAMKKAVLDVKDFIHRLPSSSLAPEIQKDFNVAYELVMVEKQPVSKPRSQL